MKIETDYLCRELGSAVYQRDHHMKKAKEFQVAMDRISNLLDELNEEAAKRDSGKDKPDNSKKSST